MKLKYIGDYIIHRINSLTKWIDKHDSFCSFLVHLCLAMYLGSFFSYILDIMQANLIIGLILLMLWLLVSFFLFQILNQMQRAWFRFNVTPTTFFHQVDLGIDEDGKPYIINSKTIPIPRNQEKFFIGNNEDH